MRFHFRNYIHGASVTGSACLAFSWFGLWPTKESKTEELKYGMKAYEFIKAYDSNNNNNVTEAVKLLQLDDWCVLALEAHPSIRYFEAPSSWPAHDTKNTADFLNDLNLDAEWVNAFNWYCTNIFNEDVIHFDESAFDSHRNSRDKRLLKLLNVLLHKTTQADLCVKLIEKGIIFKLYLLLNEYRLFNSQITFTILKIFANLACNSRAGAEEIVQSKLFPLFASMVEQPLHEPETIYAHKIFVNILSSINDKRLYRLAASLYELHRPAHPQTPMLDIVFVHGLGGSAFRTWRQRDNKTTTADNRTTQCWPRTWLPNDIPAPVRIIGVDYSTKLLRYGGVMSSIVKRSESLQQDFAEADIGTRPIVFICHSLGGLLVKQLLLDNEELRRKTVGVLFMATPHLGTQIASDYTFNNFLRPSDDLELLQLENKTNLQLNDNFNRISRQIPLFTTILELEKTKIFGSPKVIVPLSSGSFGQGETYLLKEQHFEICKPESRVSTSYQIVLNFVNSALRHVQQLKLN